MWKVAHGVVCTPNLLFFSFSCVNIAVPAVLRSNLRYKNKYICAVQYRNIYNKIKHTHMCSPTCCLRVSHLLVYVFVSVCACPIINTDGGRRPIHNTTNFAFKETNRCRSTHTLGDRSYCMRRTCDRTIFGAKGNQSFLKKHIDNYIFTIYIICICVRLF